MSRIFFFIILPRSWTGCGIVDCPEFVMIDTINGAVQSEINSQWLKMTENVSSFGQKVAKEGFYRVFQQVLDHLRASLGHFGSFWENI